MRREKKIKVSKIKNKYKKTLTYYLVFKMAGKLRDLSLSSQTTRISNK